jgi:SAM-dependent methyltransferase
MTAIHHPDLTFAEVSADDYHFYHTIDLPGLGEMPGEWDLRNAPDEYLGNVIVTNKRVLDMGTANGFLSFHMESKGASVVSYDVSPNDDWDIVPRSNKEGSTLATERRNRIRKINNAYRLSHNLLNSRAELVRGTIFAIPNLVRPVDITTFSNTLQHVSNPLFALQLAARITRETIVVTERRDDTQPQIISRLLGWLGAATGRTIRRGEMGSSLIAQSLASIGHPEGTGHHLTPELLKESLRVLGFGDIRISYHRQPVVGSNKSIPMYTLVANRTEPIHCD